MRVGEVAIVNTSVQVSGKIVGPLGLACQARGVQTLQVAGGVEYQCVASARHGRRYTLVQVPPPVCCGRLMTRKEDIPI